MNSYILQAFSPNLPARHAISFARRTRGGGDGARTQAQCRHSATVLTISGDIDAANVDRVVEFATRFVRIGNAVILDLSAVNFFAARSLSMLIAVDDACCSAEVQWVLVPSSAVERVTRLTDWDAALPTAGSIATAVRQLGAFTRARRRLPPLDTTAQSQCLGAP